MEGGLYWLKIAKEKESVLGGKRSCEWPAWWEELEADGVVGGAGS